MDHLDYTSVKRKIEREKCLKHNEHPKFERTGNGFNILACCEEFRTKMLQKTENIMADETKSAIEKMLKKTFR